MNVFVKTRMLAPFVGRSVQILGHAASSYGARGRDAFAGRIFENLGFNFWSRTHARGYCVKPWNARWGVLWARGRTLGGTVGQKNGAHARGYSGANVFKHIVLLHKSKFGSHP